VKIQNFACTNIFKMFTIDQISAAHSKVKSGSDFPNYIQDLVLLGVRSYETFITDGHTVFKGRDGFELLAPPKYDLLPVIPKPNPDGFKKIRWEHQQGKTDYATFCKQAAENGVEKWKVDTIRMTCSYFDVTANLMLEEKIPG
jgi:uncharacterized protein YbcV (DUF1398 family)